MSGNHMEPQGISGARGPSTATVIVVSALTAALVSAGTVFLLLRHGGTLMTQLGAGGPPEKPATATVVPELSGLRLEAADELLTGRGLRLVVEARRKGDAEAGSVVEQRPLAHSRVEAGAAVSVVVSEGSDAVEVPQLLGKSVVEARAALEAVGLTLGPVSEGSAGAPGSVVAAVPAVGTKLQPAQPVAISVGPAAKVEVPRLLGLRRSAAKERLEKRGLVVGKVSEIYDRRRRGNVVLEQSPSPKTEVSEGSEVDLIVNQGD